MTIVVAVSEGRGKDVWMACDTAMHSEELTLVMGRPKIRKYALTDGSKVGIGGAGESSAIKLCTERAMSVCSEAPNRNSDAAVHDWVQAYAEQWTAEMQALDPRPLEDSNDKFDGFLLVAYQGRIWFCEQHIAEEIEVGYAATGAGVHIAMGALYALHELWNDDMDEAAVARVAVQASIRLDKYCGGDTHLIQIPAGLA